MQGELSLCYKVWYNNCKKQLLYTFIAIFLPGYAGNWKIWLYYTISLALMV